MKKLKYLREINDYSQTEISNLLKISQQAYCQFENDDIMIPLDKLNVLCNYYKVSMDYITGLSKENNKCKEIKHLNKIDIGKRIKQFRKDKNITQLKLANEINTTQSTISAYENGKNLLLTSFAIDICKKYKISIDWLCGK